MAEITVEFESDDHPLQDVTIFYDATPASKPDRWYPGHPAEVEVWKVDPPIMDPDEAEGFIWDFLEEKNDEN